MNSFVFGKTQNNLPIMGHQFGNSGPAVLILGGVHGDETEGVIASLGLLNELHNSFPYRLRVFLVPMFNTDGVLARTRVNARGVDLNRNLPTNDWSPTVTSPRYSPGAEPCSEIENKFLVSFLDKEEPQFLMSLHSWHPLLNINGKCRAQAEIISAFTGYRIEESIGYPTPGCLGTYAGIERDMPTLTYEIQRGQPYDEIVSLHVPAICESLKVTENYFK